MIDFLSDLPSHKKVYFASDFHLGIPSHAKSLAREKKIVSWLEESAKDAQAIFLLGDLFDFWFEYKQVVPKGYVRLLGKMAELVDRGIPIVVFSGNHDLWLKDYLEKEIGVMLYHEPQSVQIGAHNFYLAHGDGLGPGDKKFKFYKRIFTNRLCQWLFRWLHPDIGVALGKWWSSDSRMSQERTPLTFHGDQEWLILHSNHIEEKRHHAYYLYGHRHLVGTHPLQNNATYINLGEWVYDSPYAVYDGQSLALKTFQHAV